MSIGTGAVAQSDRQFIDKVDNFTITLVGGWNPVSYTDAFGRQKTEFIFEDRNEGLLRVTKESLSGCSLEDKVHNELEDLKLRYACAYSGEEAFIDGLLKGIRVSLYYFDDGRNVVGAYYFLQDGDAAWILRFTGRPGSPGISRDVTDKMARSFCYVCAIASRRERAVLRNALETARRWSLRLTEREEIWRCDSKIELKPGVYWQGN
jgi:hypothetical protein